MEINHSNATEGLVSDNSRFSNDTRPGDIELSEFVSTQAESVDFSPKGQETLAPKSELNRGLLLHKVTLVFICVVIITIVWVLFFTLFVITFILIQPISPSSDSLNQNTSISRTPVARVTILNLFDDPISDLYLGVNELVLTNNGMNLTGNVSLPVDITMRYNYLRYNLSYYEQVVARAPEVDFNPSFVIFNFSVSSVNNSVVNISSGSSTLFTSFSSNKFDTFNLTVQCPDGFFYSDSFCQLPGEFCDQYHPSGNAGRIISRVGLVLLSVFGFIVSIISLLTFLVNLCKKSEAGSSESSFCKRLFSSLVTPSLLSLFLFAFICVLLFMITDLPNPNNTFCKVYESTADFVLYNMYGAIYQFFFIGFLFWVIFTLLNLLLIVSFPFRFNSTTKIKYYIFMFESVISISVPLLFVIVTLALGRGRAYVGKYQFIGLIGPTLGLFLVIFYIPFVLSCVSILTLTPLIFCKMRWNILQTTAMLGKYPKATPLEYRIAIYSFVLVILLIIIMTGLIFYLRAFSLSDDYISLEDTGYCFTYRSPASFYRNGVELRFSSTAEALMAATNSTTVPVDFMEACDRLDATNKVYPPSIYIVEAFLIRIVVSCIFIITLPTYANYQTWRQIFSYGAKHIQMSAYAKVGKR